MTLLFWPICKHLETFIKANSVFALDDVHAGYTDEPFTKDRTIEITWDEEAAAGFNAKDGNLQIWVDCWINNADRTAGAGTEALYDLLEQVLGMIFPASNSDGWARALNTSLRIAPKVQLERVISDAGTRVPQTGARAIINIEYHK